MSIRTASAIVATVVMVILILVVAVPVVSMVSVEQVQKQNEGTGNLYARGLADVELSSSTLTVGGEAMELPSSGSMPIIQGSTVALWANSTGVRFAQIAGGVSVFHNLTGLDFAFDASGSSYTLTYTDSNSNAVTVTGTSSDAIHITTGAAAYIQAVSGDTLYVNSNSSVIAAQLLNSGNFAYAKGTGVQQMTGSYVTSSTTTPITATYTAVYNDDGSYTTGTTASFRAPGGSDVIITLFVPIDYYTEQESTGTIPTLVGIIPLLLAVGVLVVLTAAFIRRD